MREHRELKALKELKELKELKGLEKDLRVSSGCIFDAGD